MHLKNLSIEDMNNQAKVLAKDLKKGEVILLNGDLGAGKTTFAGQIINSIQNKKTIVTSPTFNIVSIYETNNIDVWHFDLYRIKNKTELFEIGIEEALENAIAIIEWPQIAEDFIPRKHINVSIKISQDQNLRDITINYNF